MFCTAYIRLLCPILAFFNQLKAACNLHLDKQTLLTWTHSKHYVGYGVSVIAGYLGIQQEECEEKSCCWKPGLPDVPWCYHPQEAATTYVTSARQTQGNSPCCPVLHMTWPGTARHGMPPPPALCILPPPHTVATICTTWARTCHALTLKKVNVNAVHGNLFCIAPCLHWPKPLAIQRPPCNLTCLCPGVANVVSAQAATPSLPCSCSSQSCQSLGQTSSPCACWSNPKPHSGCMSRSAPPAAANLPVQDCKKEHQVPPPALAGKFQSG